MVSNQVEANLVNEILYRDTVRGGCTVCALVVKETGSTTEVQKEVSFICEHKFLTYFLKCLKIELLTEISIKN